MSVTLTGGVILAVALFCYLFAGRRLMPLLVFFASFSGTAVLNLGDFGMAPAVAFFVFLLLWKITSGDMLRPLNIARDHGLIILLIVLFLTLSCLSVISHATLAGIWMIQVTQTAYVIFGAAVTIVLSVEMATADGLESAVQALRLSAGFVACWGVVQAACFYGGIEYPAFLFNNSASHFAAMFDQTVGNGLSRIASVAVEPSFLAGSLMIFGAFAATLVVVDDRFRTRQWLAPLALTLLVLVASTSTTAYVGLAALALLLGLKRPSLMFVVGIIGVLTGAVLITAIPSFGDAVWNFTIGKTTSGSFSERGLSILLAFRAIAAHPLLGWGWGYDFSLSLVSTMLANVGVIGATVFAVGYGGSILTSRSARHSGARNWRHAAYAQGAENAMVVVFIQATVSGFHFMVADFWCLWAISLGTTSCLVTGYVRTASVRRRHVMPGLATAR